MKKQTLYNVTVFGCFTKEVRVYAENEEAALDYVQDICDNTDLISTADCDELELTGEEAEPMDETREITELDTCPECSGCCGSGCCGFCSERDDEHEPGDDKDWPCCAPSSAGSQIKDLSGLAAAYLFDRLLGLLAE